MAMPPGILLGVVGDLSASEIPMAQLFPATPTPTEETIDPAMPGTVSGEACFLDKDSRANTAYFENLETYELNPLPVAKDQTAYSLDLAPGQYIAYAYEKHLKAKGGLYSQAVTCGLTAGCTDHNPVAFTVEPGHEVSGIDICDWSAAEQIPPNPAPVDERLAGMVYTVYDVNYFRFDEQGKAQFRCQPLTIQMCRSVWWSRQTGGAGFSRTRKRMI